MLLHTSDSARRLGRWRSIRPALALALASACLAAFNAGAAAGATLEEIRHWNDVGQTAEAERAARSLLLEAERLHGTESAEVAEILDQLVVSLRRGGKGLRPEALEVCERALRIKERAFGKDDPRYAASLCNLGLLRYTRRDFVGALPILEQTLEIQERTLGSNDPAIAKTLLALGAAHYELGDFEAARPLTEQGVAIEEIALGKANPERAMGLNSLAVLRYAMADYSGAIPCYEEAIRLWEQSPTPNQLVIATCSNNLAAIYEEIGDHERAIELLTRALRIREREYGESDVLVASTLGTLGVALQGKGDRRAAKEALLRAVRIHEAADPRSSELGFVLTDLGWLYLSEGSVARAESAFQRSLQIHEAALGPNGSDLWLPLRGLAMVARTRGESEAARGYYERAVTIVRRKSGPRHPDLGRTLAEYASFELATGDSLAAFDKALQAAEINREHLRLTASAITERQALLFASDMDTGTDVAFAALSGTLRSRSDDVVYALWDALVRGRALILDEIGARARRVQGAGNVLQVAKRLEEARGRLANLLVHGESRDLSDGERARIARAREDVERAERDLAAGSASYRLDNERASAGLREVLSALPPRSALVSIASYGRGSGRSYAAFAAGPDRSLRYVPLGSAGAIDRLVAKWRELAGTPPTGDLREQKRAEAACRSAGRALRSKIWDPVLPALAGARIVFVVPDGSTSLLNLGALPAADSGYVVESAPTIHYVSAERDLVEAGRVHEHGTGLLAVGDPAFDRPERMWSPGARESLSAPDSAAPAVGARALRPVAYREALAGDGFQSVRFAPLPETNREIDDIVTLWGPSEQVVVLKGDLAGERAVKDLLPGRRVAHIATHGFFLGGPADAGRPGDRGIGGLEPIASPPPAAAVGANPFHLSGLALAGANLRGKARPQEEDGILVAEEIASLDLSSLDWVVLSACHTGLGDVQAGEGVLGFRRAFEIAGAGTLIMSLWAVGDQSAREWMRPLYDGRFRRRLETAEAVRQANLAVLKSLRAQGRSTHPFYWAAFIAVGDWR